jgi:hypothetical protein
MWWITLFFLWVILALPPFGLLDAPAGCFSARNALRGTLSTTARPEAGLHATFVFVFFVSFKTSR